MDPALNQAASSIEQDDDWDTDEFVIPSLGVEESDFIHTDVQEVKDFEPPTKPTKEEQEQKIYLGPHGAPPPQSKQQELNTANQKQRFKHKLQEADRKYSGTGRENKVENLRELVGCRRALAETGLTHIAMSLSLRGIQCSYI